MAQGGKPARHPEVRHHCGPHTSNWDFPIGLAFAFDLKLKGYWLGKDSMFRWPFHGFFKVARRHSHRSVRSSDVVAQIVKLFNQRAKLTMVVAPKGLAKKSPTGERFLSHRPGRRGPVVLAFIDYLKRRAESALYSSRRKHRNRHGIHPLLLREGDREISRKAVHPVVTRQSSNTDG